MRHFEDDGGPSAEEEEVVGGVHESPSAAVVGTTPTVGEVKADGASAEGRRGTHGTQTGAGEAHSTSSLHLERSCSFCGVMKPAGVRLSLHCGVLAALPLVRSDGAVADNFGVTGGVAAGGIRREIGGVAGGGGEDGAGGELCGVGEEVGCLVGVAGGVLFFGAAGGELGVVGGDFGGVVSCELA